MVKYFTISGFILTLFFVCFQYSNAFAQDIEMTQTYSLQHPDDDVLLPDHEKKEQEQKIIEMDFDDIPEAYLAEAEEYRKHCQTRRLLNTYYNCDCMALEYLQTRIDDGPTVDKSKIMLKISKSGSCVDITNAAGAMYTECKSMAPLMPVKGNTEDFCSCVGTTYAKTFKAAGVTPSSQTMGRLQRRAVSECSRKIYTLP